MRLIHRCQKGFTSVTLMGVLLVGGLLVAGSFTVVDPDIGFSKKDEDYKQANGAAEAGISYYLTRLAQDTSYYVHCTNVTPPDGPGTSPVNQPWNGTSPTADPRVSRAIPGSTSRYTIELLPATGFSTCIENDQSSMINPATGAFRIRSTGTMGSRKRSIVATLRRKGFIDFLYFTNRETSDPSTYSSSADQTQASSECDAPRQSRTSFCSRISFIDADEIRGPFHSNDSILVCGSPDFGVDANDIIELNQNSPGYFATNGCSAAPNFKGTLSYPSGVLPMPTSNAELRNTATSAYQFNGNTRILLKGDTMDVTYPGGSKTGLALPANGVIYVNNVACSQGYQRTNTFRTSDALQSTCGDVQVSGTYNKDITIGADNDIIVTDDLKRGGSAPGVLAGLIANNFVRVYHPVNYSSGNCAGNATGGPGSITIEAALLALNHSFIVDNWFCGSPVGTLTVYGAIAQYYRGPVGTFLGGNVASGYVKSYDYNYRLKNREPPFFITPTDSPWQIVRQNEQVPPR